MDSSFSSLGFVLPLGFFTILGMLIFLVYKKFRSKPQNETVSSSLHHSCLPSSPPLSSVISGWLYDVFPSFHREDVRRSFLSHILVDFRRRGISTFVDYGIKRGNLIVPELHRAIRSSRSAIVMLSRNYASSLWCLDELAEIMECRELWGLGVVPVSYELDVKKQTGDFGKFFRKKCKGKTKEHIERWRLALTQVAVIAGYHSRTCLVL